MIRINLLGRTRPKATRTTVPLEATLQYVLLADRRWSSAAAPFTGTSCLLDRENTKIVAHIQKQTGEKARLDQLKQQVDNFEKQKAVLQQRIGVIEGLQRNRTGGQELLEAIANTVSRTDTLWLTSVERKGDALTINGVGGIHQRGRELHHATQAIGLLPNGGNQGIAPGRSAIRPCRSLFSA